MSLGNIRELSTPSRAYLGAVITLGSGALVSSILRLANEGRFEPEWLLLTALTLLTGAFGIKLPNVSARISVSEAFVFAAAAIFGPEVATVVVAVDSVALTTWTPGNPRSWLRAAFTISAGTSAIFVASHLFALLAPHAQNPSLEHLVAPFGVLALSYFLLNSGLIAFAVSAETGQPVVGLWQRNFAWIGLNHLGGASLAVLLVTYRQAIDLPALLVVVPLLLIIYLTFRTSLARLEEANANVSRLNDLYLSTIEALALAVDAKDQITHGHIRRVQLYATEVAKRLGIDDPTQLRAIEVAALLHDMGKLAIPEHILNKPGRLTAAEFETMKRHSDIGADLLASVRFPYPVVPIVRHHHEQWDGEGYPSRIAGTDIPVGARILSVVDCFDALNSDRPYRSKLSVEDAFEVLRARRGTMYDPLVVDTFIEAYPAISSTAGAILAERGISTTARLETTNASVPAERGRLGNDSSDRVAESIVTMLEQRLPKNVAIAFFSYDIAANMLACSHATSNLPEQVRGVVIRPGDRVTGWVAANIRAAVNCDPALDIGDASLGQLGRMVSVPILDTKHAELRGVVSVYSFDGVDFTPEHVRLIESAALLASRRPQPRRLTTMTRPHVTTHLAS